MTIRRTPDGHEPLDPEESVVADDLGNAELIESAGMQNAVAATGPGALAMIPLAWALTRLRRLLARGSTDRA